MRPKRDSKQNRVNAHQFDTRHSLRVIEENCRLIQQIITLCSLSKHCDRTTKNLFLLMSKRTQEKLRVLSTMLITLRIPESRQMIVVTYTTKIRPLYLRRRCVCH